MTDQAETTTPELAAEDLDQVVGGITDGTSNTLICRKAGGTQQDWVSGGESSLIGLL
jgi:hypothetical protein